MGREKRLKVQFINGINDHYLMTDLTRDLTAIKNTNKISSEQLLAGTRRVEKRRAQKGLMKPIKENKDFNDGKKVQKNNTFHKPNKNLCINCKYSRSTQLMKLAGQKLRNSTTLSWCAGARLGSAKQ